jgi:putative ABC transport system permease protein
MAGMSDASGTQTETLQVAALVVVMALIEVVLLAGPSFAVGARRQQRNLALVAASGGTPRQMRRVILAGAVVLGGIAAVLGLGLGLLAARLLVPWAQGFSGERFGPFDVRPLHLLGIAVFGLASALLAALVPAWVASRQDVVAVLGGRRGDRRPSLRSPVLGVVLLGVGVAWAAAGTRRAFGGEFSIAASAIPTVLGMVLLIPVILVLVSRVAGVLPLPARYALGSAAARMSQRWARATRWSGRHRTNRSTATAGCGSTRSSGERAGDHRTVLLEGLPDVVDDRPRGYAVSLPGGGHVLSSYSSTFGASILVGAQLPDVELGLDGVQAAQANAMLREGGAVVFVDQVPSGRDEVRFRVEEYAEDVNPPRRGRPVTRARRPRCRADARRHSDRHVPGARRRPAGPGHAGEPFIDVPWTMITGVVLGLPVLTALVVGLCARSRLPMVARVE